VSEVEALEFGERLAALEAAVEARTRDLTAALDQRTALLHELDHRVKNNLQLISSLMLMQARRSADPAVKAALGGMIQRLNAVATVHRRLFQTEDIDRFDISEFVRDLVADLAGASGRPEVRFSCKLAPVKVSAVKAASMALLINELVANVLKHAFPDGRPGLATITIVENSTGLGIEILDDGVGIGGQDGKAADDAQGFGLTIVELLGRQLQARITREDAHPGVRTRVEMPLESVRGVA
jgi:two-component sensor histidine kinase